MKARRYMSSGKHKNKLKTLVNRISSKLFLLSKNLYQFLMIRKTINPNILFIIGCQRSGTTLMTQIFVKDYNTKVYGEFSELSSKGKDKLRLNSLDSVEDELKKVKTGLIILKPLVETQNILKLLRYFKGSRALWMFRHYQDVVSSNLKRFGIGNGINNLRPIIMSEKGNWRSENISTHVKEIVQRYYSEDMNPYDAAALFWFVRNRIFFELELDKNPSVLMCKYEDLVSKPFENMKRIYEFCNADFPGGKIVSEVHSKSVKKGANIQLSIGVESLCEELYKILEDTSMKKKKYYNVSD